MVETSRRHGHFDPRFRVAGRARLALVPNTPLADPGAEALVGDLSVSALQPALAQAGGHRGNGQMSSWENEGGSVPVEPGLPAENGVEPSERLDWYAFLERRFPHARRHDLEALKAYEAYRAGADQASLAALAR